MEMTTVGNYAALRTLLQACGLPGPDAHDLAKRVLYMIDRHDPEDIQPIEMYERDVLEEMDEVDDVDGMADALGSLATALVNIEDATN